MNKKCQHLDFTRLKDSTDFKIHNDVKAYDLVHGLFFVTGLSLFNIFNKNVTRIIDPDICTDFQFHLVVRCIDPGNC